MLLTPACLALLACDPAPVTAGSHTEEPLAASSALASASPLASSAPAPSASAATPATSARASAATPATSASAATPATRARASAEPPPSPSPAARASSTPRLPRPPAIEELARHPDRAIAAAQAMMQRGEHPAARELLSAAERRHPNDARFAPLIERACDEDPAYAPAVARLVPEEQLTAIKHLGGGSSITLKLLKGDHIVGVLKPAQQGSPNGYRAEIASWRLCPLIRCDFHIAYNRLVRIEHSEFLDLYGRIHGDKQIRYQQRFTDLKLHQAADGSHWVYGALEDWVDEFASFPIERTATWTPWLRQSDSGGVPLSQLDQFAASAISIEDTRGHEGMHKLLMRHMRGTSRRQLARQLSDLIAFDFLVSNWDRFSTSEKFIGANCQIRRGVIVSIDNGAAFPSVPQKAPGERLQLIQRFSRQFVSAIRRLDHDATSRRLFGKLSRGDKRRFALFWSQRQALLDYIDALIAQYGKAQVLSFD